MTGIGVPTEPRRRAKTPRFPRGPGVRLVEKLFRVRFTNEQLAQIHYRTLATETKLRLVRGK